MTTRSELVARLGNKMPPLAKAEVEAAVGCIIGHITDRLACGGRIEVRGFGGLLPAFEAAAPGTEPENGGGGAVARQGRCAFQAGQGHEGPGQQFGRRRLGLAFSTRQPCLGHLSKRRLTRPYFAVKRFFKPSKLACAGPA